MCLKPVEVNVESGDKRATAYPVSPATIEASATATALPDFALGSGGADVDVGELRTRRDPNKERVVDALTQRDDSGGRRKALCRIISLVVTSSKLLREPPGTRSEV